MSIPFQAWAFSSGLVVVWMEVIFRRADGYAIWWVFPAALINYLLFRTFQGAPSLLAGAVTTGLAIIAFRVAASHFILGEAIAKGNLVAAVMLAAGAIAASYWR